jgi:TonB family protein
MDAVTPSGDSDLERELRDLPAIEAPKLTEEQKPPEEAKKEEEPRPPAPGQVVDVPRPAEEKQPTKPTKYVSEYDTSVEKQTKARANGQVGAAPGPKTPPVASAPPSPPRAPQPRVQEQNPREVPPGPLAMRSPTEDRRAPGAHAGKSEAPATPEELSPEGGEEKSPNGVLPEKGQQHARANEGGAPPPGAKPQVPSLIPSDKQLMRSISGGGGGTNDYLKDVDEGDETALNSKKWKFASFFNRVKRGVAEHWRPDIEYRRRDPSGNVYGLRDRVTVLRVSLKPDGSLANVIVEQPCGVDFLDDEAIAAFRAAQPFPNPPRQLVEENGLIQFRFAFIFEISSSPTFKIFRYN